MRRFLHKKFLFLILLPFLLLAVLEYLSYRPCADLYKKFENPCFDLIYNNVYLKSRKLTLSLPKEKKVKLSDIRTSDFLDNINENTIFLPMSDVKANGRVCGSYAFVSEELPHLSKRYVTIHENIHLLGEYNEARTNYLAAALEPVGFAETAAYSLWLSFRSLEFSKFPCQIGMLWSVFKLYFLKF